MLALGDFSIDSPPADQTRTLPLAPTAERRTEPHALTAPAEEPEPRSFLLTLLRALGAIHT